MVFALTSSFDTSVITSVATTVISVCGQVVTFITSNPLLMLGIGVSLIGVSVGIVRKFVHA